jgi:hypothetical protein
MLHFSRCACYSRLAMPDAPTPSDAKEKVILDRLKDQADWYSKKSGSAQKKYKLIKVTEIIAAALIPFFSPLKYPFVPYLVGGLGVLITILEGVLQLYQFQRIWTVYRATCEALTHEQFLYLAKARPYDTGTDAAKLLAERIETIMSQENAQWLSLQQQRDKSQGSDKN